MKLYTETTDGSAIEAKESALVWHHQDADLDFGSCQSKELLDYLENVLANEPVEVKSGQHIVEVKPQGVSKGLVAQQLLSTMVERGKLPDFVLCIGDERSDEDMFSSIASAMAQPSMASIFKSNFATLDEKTGIVTSRRDDRHFEEEGPIFFSALDGIKLPSFPEYEVRVRYATEHRCGVVLKGPKLSGIISGTDPLKDNRPLLETTPLDDTEEAKHTSAVVNELSKEMSQILMLHPLNKQRASQGKSIANVVLLCGCGIRIEVPTFQQKHGLWPFMVAPTKIIAGLGLALGIDILQAPGATGDYRTLLTSKAKEIAKALFAPLEPPPPVFVPGEEDCKDGRREGYDF